MKEDPSPAEPPALDEGGEAACWLPWVCEECGALRESAEATRCWRCGAEAAVEAD